jgi:hypothetical protein
MEVVRLSAKRAGTSRREVVMFARKVSACLKPNRLKMFRHLMECELIPWLRKQEGFLDLIILTDAEEIEVQVISFWERNANAEACSVGYPEGVLRNLEELLNRIPVGKTFAVVSSTLDRFAPPTKTQMQNALAGSDAACRDYGSCDTSV